MHGNHKVPSRISKSQISSLLSSHTLNSRDNLVDLNQQINQLSEGMNQYHQNNLSPDQKQIKRILNENYKFIQRSESLKNTQLRTAYLHVDKLYNDPNVQIPQTRSEIMSMALSSNIIKKETRKEVRKDNLQKKRMIIAKIQQKINEEPPLRVIKTQSNEIIGQMTLQMIADLRNRFFNELVSSNGDEKFKKINKIKDDFIPQQISAVKEGVIIQQKEKLKHDLLSRHSQFNSYYQLLALEKTMRRLVALKLKPEIQIYSRFSGAEKPKDYSSIQSSVKKYIHKKYNEI